QDYTIRAQVSEGMSLASGVRTAVSEYYQTTGRWPVSNASAGVAESASITGNYVGSVTVSGTTISAQFSADANGAISGESLILGGTDAGGSVEWVCRGSADLDTKYLPAS